LNRKTRKRYSARDDKYDGLSLFVIMPCYQGDHNSTYPWTFVSAAVEKVRAADCRATALLAKRAAVLRIMVTPSV
jgi:hypothetical protein